MSTLDRVLEVGLISVTIIGAAISLVTLAELHGCRWPLDAVELARAATTMLAHAQAGSP